ncbi:TetR/AcrR family transcriptional regulator [Kaistia geumhonensis]|uniref:AcrR family transcriptional regulator n=1 Tax=Kaistia geumhonensis TaxID=410839 RepID=A0ABU0MBG2_9HYPH|nr:TetR/AcrR family transcriptional regulator [Kaistia geumhonensis]MCX5481244.1 TetR/AcrR family transcriptional regulator [Kaistia geumhonensis]MDQ0518305.1 AcrR family transcriptional regulator [Kaistia geumhonensis]
MHQAVPDPIIDAFMSLLAEKRFEAITLPEIATRANLSLGELREGADGKLAILGAFMRRIDRAVLDEIEPGDAGGDSHRDRLFDVLMRRFDRLAAYRRSIAHLGESCRRDPALALAVNAAALPSARYMLATAGIGSDGMRGIARTEGLALLMAKVSAVWVDDTDPDQSRTMSALDRALSRAEGWDQRLGRVERTLCGIARRFSSRRSSPRPSTVREAPPAGAGDVPA